MTKLSVLSMAVLLGACSTAVQRHPYGDAIVVRPAASVLPMKISFDRVSKVFADTLADIRGIVSDSATGKPLPGAVASVVRTRNVFRTNLKGEFAFDSISVGSAILFKYAGYADKEVKVRAVIKSGK